MPSLDDVLRPSIPDSAIPELEGEEEPFEMLDAEKIAEKAEDEVDETLLEMVAEMSSFPIVMILDLTVGLEDNEFRSKHAKYKNRAIETGFAKAVAKYIEEYMPDWTGDPRFMLIIAGLMYFGYVAVDVKKTIEEKREKGKEKARDEQGGSNE